jgi:hypothetical protein
MSATGIDIFRRNGGMLMSRHVRTHSTNVGDITASELLPDLARAVAPIHQAVVETGALVAKRAAIEARLADAVTVLR